MKKQHNRGVIAQALLTGDKTIGQLIAELGLGQTTIWRWLTILIEDGQAHICAMNNPETGGPQIAVYRHGPKPPNYKVRVQNIKTPKELTTRYRKRLRASGEWEDHLHKQREYYWTSKPVKRDPLTTALFGAAQ